MQLWRIRIDHMDEIRQQIEEGEAFVREGRAPTSITGGFVALSDASALGNC